MEIVLIAGDKKKELMVEFCTAYCGILSKYHLCATGKTAKYISEATGLKIETMLSGSLGGMEQVISRICYNEVDLVLYFRDTTPEKDSDTRDIELLRCCDTYNIPVATNIATGEALVMGLDRGDLDWREFVNPRHPQQKNF